MDEPVDISRKIKFSHVCDMLERIHKARTIADKDKYLQRYYASIVKYRETFRREHNLTGPEDGRSSFHCILRCLLPNCDNSRRAYGLQKPTVGRVYTKVLHLSSDSRNAQILSNGNYFGDYADVIYQVLVPRCKSEPSKLTLYEIHEKLDSIAEDDIRTTEMILTGWIEVASALEQKWIVRLLLKSMNLGIGEQRIFAMLHPQARQVYQRCSSLHRLCCFIADRGANGDEGIPSDLNDSGIEDTLKLNDMIQPFLVVKPMLCERISCDVQALMADDVLYVETKMDGERFQLHYANRKFEYYSRNGNNYTSSFGGDYEKGPLSQQLKGLLPHDMESIILDGEMMVWDSFVKEFRQKGENTNVKYLSAHRNWWPCFVVYDILYFNGRSLLGLPYIQRIHKLRNLIQEKQGVLQLVETQKITSLEVFKEAFQKALNHQEEGIVVKKQNSLYMPGTRGGGGWYKVKADYIDGMTSDFDLLVIGGFYNDTKTFVNSFLLGVLKGNSDKFEVYSVGKVGNLTRQAINLNNELKAHWHNTIEEPPPLWYHYVATHADGRPDLWIHPRNSVILQIKAADLAPSSAFALSKSLHFPRVQMWRNDKLWQDCMSYEEYNEFIKHKRGIKKIHQRDVTLSDLESGAKVRKMTPAQQREAALQMYGKKFDVSQVTKVSETFRGFSIYVVSGCAAANVTTEQLKSLVIANGGEIVEYPLYGDPKCFCVAGDNTPQLKLLRAKHRYNIVTTTWFRRSCEQQRRLALRPRDFIDTTPEIKDQLAENYDRYGDSYTEPITEEELEQLLDEMETPEGELEQCDLDKSDEELSEDEVSKDSDDSQDDEKGTSVVEQPPVDYRSFYYYRRTRACFYTSDPIAEGLYRTFGGRLLSFSEALTCTQQFHIFIDITDEGFSKDSLKKWILEYFGKNLSNLKIVDVKWIKDTLQAGHLLDANEYSWHGM